MYRQPTTSTAAAPDRGLSVGKPFTDTDRHGPPFSCLSVPVGKQVTDTSSRFSIDQNPRVGMSVRCQGGEG